jgi:transcriptional regulator with XRE-family HTH domain
MPTKFITEIDPSLRLAQRLRARRLALGYSRKRLGELAAVSPETLRAFERTGQVSLCRFIRLADALGLGDEVAALFASPTIRSLEELPVRRTRQRGRS